MPLRRKALGFKEQISKEFIGTVERTFRFHAEAAAPDVPFFGSGGETITDLSQHKGAAHAQLAARADGVMQPGLDAVRSLTSRGAVDDVLK